MFWCFGLDAYSKDTNCGSDDIGQDSPITKHNNTDHISLMLTARVVGLRV